MAITQLGLHGPQMAYGTFAAKELSSIFTTVLAGNVWIMQRRSATVHIEQQATDDAWIAQRVSKTVRIV